MDRDEMCKRIARKLWYMRYQTFRSRKNRSRKSFVHEHEMFTFRYNEDGSWSVEKTKNVRDFF